MTDRKGNVALGTRSPRAPCSKFYLPPSWGLRGIRTGIGAKREDGTPDQDVRVQPIAQCSPTSLKYFTSVKAKDGTSDLRKQPSETSPSAYRQSPRSSSSTPDTLHCLTHPDSSDGHYVESASCPSSLADRPLEQGSR